MTKRLLVVAPLLAVCLAFGQADQKAISAMFAQQTDAANKGDIVAYMATIDPQSAGYLKTKDAMTKVFAAYKLKFTAESFKVLSVKGATAQVQTTMVTKKISGPAFKNNRLKMTINLIKRSGKWLMTSSKIGAIEYLN